MDEFQKRKENFDKKEKFINDYNNRPEITFTVGLNEYSDWDEDELKKLVPVDPSIRTSTVNGEHPHLKAD
jgi:hypothetical protein